MQLVSCCYDASHDNYIFSLVPFKFTSVFLAFFLSCFFFFFLSTRLILPRTRKRCGKSGQLNFCFFVSRHMLGGIKKMKQKKCTVFSSSTQQFTVNAVRIIFHSHEVNHMRQKFNLCDGENKLIH